jgi:hypothetical protein
MEEPSQPTLSDTLDLILRKYGKVWIWSILLTINATYFLRLPTNIGVMSFNLRGPMNPNGSTTDPFALIVFASGLVEAVAILFSFFWLFQFMVSDLFPIFFDVEGGQGIPNGARLLYRSFGAILVSLGSQVAIYALGLVVRLQ